MSTYGIPYQGSKSRIADWVVGLLPASDTLVDLFAGGCAVTHAALLSGKWEHIIANDLSDAPQVFLDAANGEFDGWATIPSRDEFNRLKGIDDAVALLFSFGNNREDYAWGGAHRGRQGPRPEDAHGTERTRKTDVVQTVRQGTQVFPAGRGLS